MATEKITHRSKFEELVMAGLDRKGETKEWLAGKLRISMGTLTNWFRSGDVKPAERLFIGTLLDIPELTDGLTD